MSIKLYTIPCGKMLANRVCCHKIYWWSTSTPSIGNQVRVSIPTSEALMATKGKPHEWNLPNIRALIDEIVNDGVRAVPLTREEDVPSRDHSSGDEPLGPLDNKEDPQTR